MYKNVVARRGNLPGSFKHRPFEKGSGPWLCLRARAFLAKVSSRAVIAYDCRARRPDRFSPDTAEWAEEL